MARETGGSPREVSDRHCVGSHGSAENNTVLPQACKIPVALSACQGRPENNYLSGN
jgi:hypothetical protein